jgi:hypothetical protein
MIADHYGLFDDLFKHGYFIPRIPLHVNYPYDNDQVTPVFSGNRLYAKDVNQSIKEDVFFYIHGFRLMKNLK